MYVSKKMKFTKNRRKCWAGENSWIQAVFFSFIRQPG